MAPARARPGAVSNGPHGLTCNTCSWSRGAILEVRDTGLGMTAEELGRTFDRFHKGAGSTGSGLGLTIARNLVAAHGGELRASSEPGRGVRFTAVFPATRDDPRRQR